MEHARGIPAVAAAHVGRMAAAAQVGCGMRLAWLCILIAALPAQASVYYVTVAGLGDVYKRQPILHETFPHPERLRVVL